MVQLKHCSSPSHDSATKGRSNFSHGGATNVGPALAIGVNDNTAIALEHTPHNSAMCQDIAISRMFILLCVFYSLQCEVPSLVDRYIFRLLVRLCPDRRCTESNSSRSSIFETPSASSVRPVSAICGPKSRGAEQKLQPRSTKQHIPE
jgi:hypothetical protein